MQKSQLLETGPQPDPDSAASQSMMGDSSGDLIVSQTVDLSRSFLADARPQVPEIQPQPCPDPAAIPSARTEDEDTSQPIAQRRARRIIRLPPRFRDDMPQPLTALPSQPATSITNLNAPPSSTSEHPALAPELPLPAATTSSPGQRARRLDSMRNAFQIFRRYYAVNFPLHDPDEGLPLAYFSDIAEQTSNEMVYSPYPNKSSFMLGDWFWSRGTQKSIEDFNALLQVLKSPGFSVDDIKNTQWNLIHNQLGSSDLDECNTPWSSDVDAGWIREPITLTVPFHKQQAHPGNKTFQAGNFYRRSIVEVMRERIASADGHHFHHEPYELYWQPRLENQPIRVFGDLYTSPEFLHVHQELQSSPPEPGCTLPRVVVGLIFSSDVTHLSQFGDAKLWPVYLFFGNDSKYRRCKPSCYLCNHIAYLQAVGFLFSYY